MPRVTVSIPQLGVTEKGWEKNKEIYVIGIAADLNSSSKLDEDPIGAYNETIPKIAPEISKISSMRWFVASASNVFNRIRADQPVSLSGSGIILYPNLDPNGMLALHLSIVECDEGKRKTGKILNEILGDANTTAAVEGLSKVLEKIPLVAAMKAITGVVPTVLKKNKDNRLFDHNHSGFDYDHYGTILGQTVTDFVIGNDLAHCTLRIRLIDG